MAEIRFADPHKVCLRCGDWVDGALDGPGRQRLLPCYHTAGYEDLCPSWSPTDGCRCAEQRGAVDHPTRERVGS